MTPAIALLVVGGLLLVSGWKNIGIADVINGTAAKLPTGNAPDYEQQIADNTVAGPPAPEGLHNSTPGLTMFDGHAVSRWIVPVLQWARRNGWKGTVQSGYRTFTQQAHVDSAFGPKAPAGTSNHESVNWPGGAVDVSDYNTLASLVPHYPGPGPTLVSGAIIGDPLHFSATGH